MDRRESKMQSQLRHINPTACAAFAVTGPLAEARACMRCIRVIQAKSTPEASNQTADVQEVEEEETNIFLKGRTNMRQISREGYWFPPPRPLPRLRFGCWPPALTWPGFPGCTACKRVLRPEVQLRQMLHRQWDLCATIAMASLIRVGPWNVIAITSPPWETPSGYKSLSFTGRAYMSTGILRHMKGP